MTSNIGAEMIKNQAGFGFGKRTEEANYEKMKDLLKKEVDRYFRPEFLNRLDDLIVFKSLTRVDLETIVDYELKKVYERLAEQDLHLELSEEAKQFLIEKGYDIEFGARPLRRAIERNIEDPLSEDILRGNFKGVNTIKVTVKDGHLHFEGVSATQEESEQKQNEKTEAPLSK